MKHYILFIFGSFDDDEEVEFFCSDIFPELMFNSVKYVVEGLKNMVITFETDKTKFELSKSLYETLSLDYIKFYFIFERDSIVSTYMPQYMNDFIYQVSPGDLMKIDYDTYVKKDKPHSFLDEILDKIDRTGVDSLSKDEKNFLDNFEN